MRSLRSVLLVSRVFVGSLASLASLASLLVTRSASAQLPPPVYAPPPQQQGIAPPGPVSGPWPPANTAPPPQWRPPPQQRPPLPPPVYPPWTPPAQATPPPSAPGAPAAPPRNETPPPPKPAADTAPMFPDSGINYVENGSLRVNVLWPSGTDLTKPSKPAGVMLYNSFAVAAYDGILTGRGWMFGGVGAGSAGFEGAFGGGANFGVFYPFGDGQGPFVRAGFDGAMLGNQDLYFSWFEVPQLRAGAMLIPGGLLEVGVHTGPVLAGYFNIGDNAHRDDGGSAEFGPYASFMVGPLQAETGWTRILARGSADKSPVDIVRAMACAFLCVDVWYVHGTTELGAPNRFLDSSAVYAGFGLGYGSGINK